ncbi:MAG: alpha/beta fold hydrolase [Xanthomonadales bacterium PRO7]|nr:alpha/beta fold hydrolase [Xanthomonadales bacterium PRO7]
MTDSARTDSGVFDPPLLLRNAHVQSVLSSSFLRRAAFRRNDATLENTADECILDCGNGVRLQGFHSAQRVRSEPRALVVLLHGWEGSAQSNYILHTGARLLAEGCDVFRLNFRDHGGTQALNRELFHSCRIAEVVGAVVEIARRFPVRPLVVGGFSLGGNFALRVALRAPAAGIPLAWTFAVCPVISPRAGLRAIEDAPWFYEFYFMRKWRESLRRKQALFPELELFAREQLRGGLRDLTRQLVEQHTDFGTLENYLDGYSIAGDTLAALTVPANILTAEDDPVIPVAGFRELKLAPQTELTIVPHGGHCGFIRDFSLNSWAEDFILAQMQRRLPI